MSEAVDLLFELAAIPSPPGEERGVADVVLRYLTWSRTRPGRRCLRTADRLDRRQRLRAGRADRRGDAALPLRAHGHGSAGREARAGRRGRHRPERRRHDPRLRQQGGDRGDARGRPARAGRERPACRDRARVHADGGGRPDRRWRVRPRAARGAGGLRLRPGGADGRGRPRRTMVAGARGSLPRPFGARGHGARGGALCDPGGREGDRRPSARAGGRVDDGERRDDHRWHGRQRRARVVHVQRRGALSRRGDARRGRTGDARRVLVSPRPRRSATSRRRCARATTATG